MKKNKSTILVAKNDFEGVASSILLNIILDKDLDIIFCKYNLSIDKIHEFNLNQYDTVIFLDMLNMDKVISTANIYCCKTFADIKNIYPQTYKQMLNSYEKLKVFNEEVTAYLDWSWYGKNMFCAKNLDELSKYYNKNKLINKISNRIIYNKDIINSLDKEVLVFSKKLISYYINNKNYFIKTKGDKKIAFVIAENNEIELANKIIEKEKVDAVYLANLNNGMIRIKTHNDTIKKNIALMNGRVNSNGGTIQIKDSTMKQINKLLFNDIIESL